MLQKNCENEIRELSRDQQEMLDEHIDRLNKVFKGKDNYAGIAVMERSCSRKNCRKKSRK